MCFNMAITLGLLPQCFSNALHWGQRPWTSDAVYTTKTTVIPESSTVYFVALAFHLILGIDPRTRTLTNSFGDCSAAITLGGCIILVEQRGFEPLHHYWPPGYSRVPFLSGVYSIKLIWSPAWHCSAGNCVVFKTWRCVGESNSHLRIDNPR